MKESIAALMTMKKVKKSCKKWRNALTSDLDNFFTYEKDDHIHRIDRYELEKDAIKFILNNKEKIENISVLMGVGKTMHYKKNKKSRLDNQIFQPILKTYFKEDTQITHHHFSTKPSLKPTDVNLIRSDGELDPIVAKLFLLNWQSLTESELINAFEGLVGKKISSEEETEKVEITFGQQKIHRVNEYIFTKEETKGILDNLNAVKERPYFAIALGSGLKVPNFHPFSFRPVINIKEVTKGSLGDDSGSNYYDTSRPCPPICPPDN